MAFNYSFRVAVSLAVALLAGVMWTVDVFWGALCTALLPIALYWQQKLYRHHVRKVLFMLDAIENNDNAIHFSETENTADARLVNRALNRVAHILYNVKSETAQQEKILRTHPGLREYRYPCPERQWCRISEKTAKPSVCWASMSLPTSVS